MCSSINSFLSSGFTAASLKQEGYEFCFLDESYVDRFHSKGWSLFYADNDREWWYRVEKAGKGTRVCIIQAITGSGPVEGSLVILRPQSKAQTNRHRGRTGRVQENSAGARNAEDVPLPSQKEGTSDKVTSWNIKKDYHRMFNSEFFKDWFIGLLGTLKKKGGKMAIVMGVYGYGQLLSFTCVMLGD